MGVRKNSRSLTDDEKTRFTAALDQINTGEFIEEINAGGVRAEFALLHANLFNSGIHTTSHFLPWHREFILRFERKLQEFDPSVSIPYWDAARDQIPSDPLFWGNNYLERFDANWGLGRRFLVGRVELADTPRVEANQGRNDYASFGTELENDIHNPCHSWVGGAASRVDSPRDPAFFLIHAWIDLLWARWQMAHPNAFDSSGMGRGLNDPMPGWPDRTPASVLNPLALGYAYDIEGVRVPPLPPETIRDIALGIDIHIKDFGVFDDRTKTFSLFERGRVSPTRLHDEKVIRPESVGDVSARLVIKMDHQPDNSVSVSYTAELYDEDERVAQMEGSVNAPPDVPKELTGIHLVDHHGGDPDTADMKITVKNTQAV